MSNFGVEAADGSCADKQSGEGGDSLLGYFYQCYSHNLLSILAGMAPPPGGLRQTTAAMNHLSGSILHL